MSRRDPPRATPASETPPDMEAQRASVDVEAGQMLELREAQLVAHKDLRDLGEIEVRTEVDQIPGRLEVDAYREEVAIEHETVGEVVSERREPWEEDDVLIIPVYEEQLVVSKRLVLRERIRVRRISTTERQLYQDTLRRERLVVEDPQHTGSVRENYPVGEVEGDDSDTSDRTEPGGGFLRHLVRKALE
jgi:uncharacterized protein (TIGR02271 family)